MAQFNSANTPNNNFIVDSDGFIVVGPNGKPVNPVSMFPQRKNSLMKQNNSTQGMVGNSTRSGLEAATRYRLELVCFCLDINQEQLQKK